MNKSKLVGRAGADTIFDCDGIIIGTWNGKSVKSLFRTLMRAMRNYDSAFSSSDIPHREQIPTDLSDIPGDVFVWACDVGGNCLANLEDGGEWEIVHASKVRQLVAEEEEWA